MAVLMALFGLGGLAALTAFYVFMIRTRHTNNAREVSAQLAVYCRSVHDTCDRPTLDGSDRRRLGEIVPIIDRMVKALSDGGPAGDLTLPSPAGEERDRAMPVRAAWDKVKPVLERLARNAPEEAEPAAPHSRLHPEVADLDAAAVELIRWWRDLNLRHRQNMLYILIAVAALNCVLLALGTQRMRQRVVAPIRRLQEGAAHIRAGNFSHRVPAASDDELGSLARSFNEMSSEIDRLLRESQEATARIAETNRELERALRQHQRSEEQLRKSETRLARAQQISHTGNWEVTIASGEMYWSADVFRIFGLEPETTPLHVSRFWDAVHPDDLEAVRRASRDAIAGAQPYRIDHRIIRPDGSVRHVRQQAEIQVENGVAASMEGTVQDISEFKRLEEQLRHSQKMEAIGRLAGGIAHDFNNLLTVILGFTRMSLDALAGGRPINRYLETVLTSGERASTLTAQLLAFSRKQVLQPRVVDVNELIRGLEPMLRQLVTEGVQITIDPGAAAPRVRVDPGQFEQVMLNLAANSRDAMPNGGRLLIETSNTFIDRESAGRKEGLVAGPHVLVAVSDNGAGMDGETLSRVFEPFFTTKGPGKGTGLGLSTAYGIVKQSGGDVTVYSEPGCGTTVRIYLPETSEARQDEPASASGISAGGHETLLVVEDEAAVRALSVEVLRDAGYHVLDAGSAADAMRVAAAHQGPIDLLVTDVIMPGGAGPELARKLIVDRPGLHVLYMSGYTEGAVAQHGDLHRGASFLPKPFTPALLLDGVRNALDRGGTASR